MSAQSWGEGYLSALHHFSRLYDHTDSAWRTFADIATPVAAVFSVLIGLGTVILAALTIKAANKSTYLTIKPQMDIRAMDVFTALLGEIERIAEVNTIRSGLRTLGIDEGRLTPHFDKVQAWREVLIGEVENVTSAGARVDRSTRSADLLALSEAILSAQLKMFEQRKLAESSFFYIVGEKEKIAR